MKKIKKVSFEYIQDIFEDINKCLKQPLKFGMENVFIEEFNGLECVLVEEVLMKKSLIVN